MDYSRQSFGQSHYTVLYIDCPITRGKTNNSFSKTPLTKFFAESTEIREYLTGADVNVQVVEMWECEWQALKEANPAIQRFLDTTFIQKEPSYTIANHITKEKIIKSVEDGSLFGLVGCDIRSRWT